MPFLTLAQVEKRFRPNILTVLQREGMFDAMEASAALRVRDITGVAIPTNAVDAPDWVVMPMVWLISKYASAHINGGSDSFYKEINDDYSRAERELAAHRAKPTTSPNGIAGLQPIDGELAW